MLCSLPLLSACSSKPGYFEAVAPSTPERAVLYLFRPEASNPGMQPLRFAYPDILIDGKSVGMLKFDSHFYVDLAAGSHQVRVTGLTQGADWEPRDIQQTISLEPGEVKYLKLDVGYQLDEMVLGESGAKYRINLIPVSAEQAVYEIRTTSRRMP